MPEDLSALRLLARSLKQELAEEKCCTLADREMPGWLAWRERASCGTVPNKARPLERTATKYWIRYIQAMPTRAGKRMKTGFLYFGSTTVTKNTTHAAAGALTT